MTMRRFYKFLISIGLLFTSYYSFGQNGLIQSNLVVYEHFTNASCGPCAAANPAFNSLMLANSANVLAIRHHVSWPGFDPMYNFNPLDPSRLVTYYGVTSIPNLRLGNTFASHPNNISQSTINTHILNLPNIWTYNIGTQYNNGIVNVIGSVFSSILAPNNDNTIRIYLVEDSIIYSTPPGNNGETFFPNVLRKILPDSNGIFCGNGSSITNFNFSFILPANVNFSKLSLVRGSMAIASPPQKSSLTLTDRSFSSFFSTGLDSFATARSSLLELYRPTVVTKVKALWPVLFPGSITVMLPLVSLYVGFDE
ncbi:MAG: hypothetical protein EBX50_16285 [Chitinophagia bacterium]|nr:hypothetical protein [Chitinophagia bacterium]